MQHPIQLIRKASHTPHSRSTHLICIKHLGEDRLHILHGDALNPPHDLFFGIHFAAQKFHFSDGIVACRGAFLPEHVASLELLLAAGEFLFCKAIAPELFKLFQNQGRYLLRRALAGACI